MMKSVPNYIIHANTMCLVPAKHKNYATIVYEVDRIVYVEDSPMQLIRQTLELHFRIYESVKTTIYKRLGFKKKIPIPIHLTDQYLFPTHAVDHVDCSWISEQHIAEIRKGTNEQNARIVFKNGQTILTPSTRSSLKRQRKRTREVRRIGVEVVN